MASEKVLGILASIEALNVLELVELKQEMESKWGGNRRRTNANGYADDGRADGEHRWC